VLERALGEGRTAVFNISADRDWTDWPTDPSYPVILQEWTRHLASRRAEGRSVKAFDAISWRPEVDGPPAVVDPWGVKRPAVLEGGTARFDRTDMAGFYIASSGPAAAAAAAAPGAGARSAGARWFAVNRSAEEGDLTPVSQNELRAVLNGFGIPFSFQGSGGDGEMDLHEGDIWRWIAIAAGLLLLGELGLASWMGRR